MKKFLALFVAFTMCISFFSCEDKKKNEDISGEISEEVSDTVGVSDDTSDTGDTVVEKEFRTYEESDFKTINIPVRLTDEEAPVVLKSCDIPDIDFGERLAPCKTSDDPSQFDPMSRAEGYTWTDENGVEHKPESTYMQLLDTPEEGIITGAAKYGDSIYMVVNYDSFCSGCHEWSVYEYNISTRKSREVYNYSGTDMEHDISYRTAPQIAAGHMLFTAYDDNTGHMLFTAYDGNSGNVKETIEAIDLKTGECREIYSSDGEYYNYLTDGTSRMNFYSVNYLDNTGNKMKLTVNEYDFDTGEIKTITENEETKMFSTAISGLCAYLRKPVDSRKYELVTEHYSIKTNMTNACILYASDKKAMLITGNSEDILHTFDLEKMEHYITELGYYSGLQAYYGESLILSDNNMSNAGTGNIYYMIPDMGLVYRLGEKIPHDGFAYSDGTVTMNAVEEAYIELTENGKRGYLRPTTVYWIEDRE